MFWGAVVEVPILEPPFVVVALLQGHPAKETTFVVVLLHFDSGTALSVGLQVLHCCSVQVQVVQGRICRRTTCWETSSSSSVT